MLNKKEFEVNEQAIKFLHGYASFQNSIMKEIVSANPFVFIWRNINGEWFAAEKECRKAISKAQELIFRFYQ